MLTRSDIHELPVARSSTRERRAWYRSRRTWRFIGEALYFPIAAIVIYLLVWFLARTQLAIFAQSMGNVN